MVIKDIEREDIEFVCKSLGCRPAASLDHFSADILGSADLVEEIHTGESKVTKVSSKVVDKERCLLYFVSRSLVLPTEAKLFRCLSEVPTNLSWKRPIDLSMTLSVLSDAW